MAISFDGTNLLVILDSNLNVDVEKDLYSRWKDFVKTGTNARFTFAFQSEGGGPIVGALEQGAYIRLNNDLGWRIRPAEADATYLFTGNLIPADPTLPMLVPTLGAFTVLINGLQPITQNVDRLVSDIWTRVLDGSFTMEQALAVLFAATTGTGVATPSTGRIQYKSADGSKDRLDAILTVDGDRAITLRDGT